ncbi:unnamed protein product, partial [Darwinula stevensoni]
MLAYILYSKLDITPSSSYPHGTFVGWFETRGIERCPRLRDLYNNMRDMIQADLVDLSVIPVLIKLIQLLVLAIEVTWQERLGVVSFNSYPKNNMGSRDCQSLNGDHLLIITQDEGLLGRKNGSKKVPIPQDKLCAKSGHWTLSQDSPIYSWRDFRSAFKNIPAVRATDEPGEVPDGPGFPYEKYCNHGRSIISHSRGLGSGPHLPGSGLEYKGQTEKPSGTSGKSSGIKSGFNELDQHRNDNKKINGNLQLGISSSGSANPTDTLVQHTVIPPTGVPSGRVSSVSGAICFPEHVEFFFIQPVPLIFIQVFYLSP